jgi:uncharacterized C2H2 Zn-finger protein
MAEPKPTTLRRRESDIQKKCPDCKAYFDQEDYATHRFMAHGEDRRKSKEEQTPPPPEKRERRTPKTEPKSQDGEEQKSKTNPWFRRPS